MENSRRYPIGIQTFERIIREGYVYVDKTNLMWKMTRVSPFVFMSFLFYDDLFFTFIQFN